MLVLGDGRREETCLPCTPVSRHAYFLKAFVHRTPGVRSNVADPPSACPATCLFAFARRSCTGPRRKGNKQRVAILQGGVVHQPLTAPEVSSDVSIKRTGLWPCTDLSTEA